MNPPGSSWGSEELFAFELVEESGGHFGRHSWESGRETACSLIPVSPGSLRLGGVPGLPPRLPPRLVVGRALKKLVRCSAPLALVVERCDRLC